MRLRCGKITKREVRRPIRRYVWRMTTHRNNNGEQPNSSARTSTIYAPMMEPIPSIASTTAIPSTTVSLITLPEGTFLSPIPQSHRMTPRQFVASDFRPFATNFTMLMPGREQPYGMPTTMTTSLHNNPSTFEDNVVNVYSPIMTSGLSIRNHGRTMQPHVGMGFGSQAMPALTTNFVMEMQ